MPSLRAHAGRISECAMYCEFATAYGESETVYECWSVFDVCLWIGSGYQSAAALIVK